MNYLTNYYKNLSEQLQEQVNYLESHIQQLNEIKQGRAMRLSARNPNDPRVLAAMARQAYRIAKTGVAQDVQTDNLIRGFGIQPPKATYGSGYGSYYVGGANYSPSQIDMPGARLPARNLSQTEAEIETGNANFSTMKNPEQQKAAPVAARKAEQLNNNITALAASRGRTRGVANSPGLAQHFKTNEPVELEIDDYDVGGGEYRFSTSDTYGNRYTVVQGPEDGREYRTRSSITAYPETYLSSRYMKKDGKNMVDPSVRDRRTYLRPEVGIEIVDSDFDGDIDTFDAARAHIDHANFYNRHDR